MSMIKLGSHEIELKPAGKNLELEERPGGWTVARIRREDGRIVSTRFCSSTFKDEFWIHLAGKPMFGKLLEEIGSEDSASEDPLVGLTAQFPGKVRSIGVSSGVTVEKGRELLVLEAMKMELSIKAPCDLKILKILVKEGQQIAPGDSYFEVEKVEK